MCAVSLPDNLGMEHLWTECCIHEELEVVAGGRVAVEVDRTGVLEDAAKLDEARGHHGEVGEHVRAAEEGAEGAHGIGDAAALLDDLFVAAGSFFVPLPGVLEGGDLGGGARTVLFRKKDVVVLAGVERRVEVDEVDGVGRDVVAKDGEVVAVVELVLRGGLVRGHWGKIITPPMRALTVAHEWGIRRANAGILRRWLRMTSSIGDLLSFEFFVPTLVAVAYCVSAEAMA